MIHSVHPLDLLLDRPENLSPSRTSSSHATTPDEALVSWDWILLCSVGSPAWVRYATAPNSRPPVPVLVNVEKGRLLLTVSPCDLLDLEENWSEIGKKTNVVCVCWFINTNRNDLVLLDSRWSRPPSSSVGGVPLLACWMFDCSLDTLFFLFFYEGKKRE
jgi:hypothetical protein